MNRKRKSKRLNDNEQERDEVTGRYKPVCGSTIHDNATIIGPTKMFDLQKRPRIKSTDYKTLLSKEIIDDETKYICSSCLEHLDIVTENRDNTLVDNSVEIQEDQHEPSNEDEELITQCIKIGEEIRNLIVSDVKQIGNVDSVSELKNFDHLKWLRERPEPVLHLLCSLSGIDLNTAGNAKIIILSKVVELLYYSMNSKKVLPNHFLENLLCYTFTNCKSQLSFLGNRCPGGSYTYVNNWLREQGINELLFPPGLVKSVFDNVQKIGKTHLISETNVVKTSVITSQLWVTLDPESDLQEDIACKPLKWMWEKVGEKLRPRSPRRISDYLKKTLSQYKRCFHS